MKSFFKIKTSQVVITAVLVLPLFIAAYFFYSHSKKEKYAFYKEPMLDIDVWRLPIIEPYEVMTADCCKTWNFQKLNFQGNFTADSVNFDNNCIMYYGYPNEYGFLDVKRKRIIRFDNYRQFADSLNARGIKARLFYTETVYKNWRETGQLPWAKEILVTQKGDLNKK